MMNEFKRNMLGSIENYANMAAEAWVFDSASQKIEMNRDDGNSPEMSLWLTNWNGEELANIRTTFDEFLDESQGCYIEDGWAEDFIDDLEFLKSKIQERINRLNKEMDQE